MRGPGILWMLQTAVGFSMAGPMFFLGIESLRTGDYAWAVGFLFFGALVLYFPTYLVNRIGGPRTWIRRRLGRSGSDSDDSASAEPDTDATLEADSDTDGDTSSDSTTERTAVFDRFRR